MVSYFNSLSMYRQHQTGSSVHQQTLNAPIQAQQHPTASQGHNNNNNNNNSNHQQTPNTQNAVSSVAAVVAAAQAANDTHNCGWYNYSQFPHHHQHHSPSLHHAAAVVAHQYIDPDQLLPWSAHHSAAHHYSHLQYPVHHQTYQQQQQHLQQQQQQQLHVTAVDWNSEDGNNNSSNEIGNNGHTSPHITASGSEISSPATPATPPGNNNNNSSNSNNNNNNNSVINNNNNIATVNNNNTRPGQNRSPYEWMKKPSYQSQPNPACNITDINLATSATNTAFHDLYTLDALGKTRTKDKYRVVYTEHQRLELEKEFYSSKYITIRRKAELASTLTLSERQVKIWFQNRRAKERKQNKKRCEMEQRDVKPIIDNLPSVPSMASLTITGMGMNGVMGGLMHNSTTSPPLIPPTGTNHHHHHHHHLPTSHHSLIGHPTQTQILGM